MNYNPLFVNEHKLVQELRRMYGLLQLSTGMAVLYYGESAPVGYLFLDGTVLNRNDYPELAQLMIDSGAVTTYDTNTFTLPTVTNTIIKT